eukprot:1182013-Karenia_brevis.AAC.1
MSSCGPDCDQVDDSVVRRRQRQLDIGKAQPEYVNYLQLVPRNSRSSSQPSTPDPRLRSSKRQFDRQLSEWRRKLHE